MKFKELKGLGNSSTSKSIYSSRKPDRPEFDPWCPHKKPDVVALNCNPSSPTARWEKEKEENQPEAPVPVDCKDRNRDSASKQRELIPEKLPSDLHIHTPHPVTHTN